MKQTILTIMIVILLLLAATGCITYNEANDPTDPEVVYVTQTPEPSRIPEFEMNIKGAKITGTAPPNSTATLTTKIFINNGMYEYIQTVTVFPDGTFTLIAPYPTDDLIPSCDGGVFDRTTCDMYTVTTAIGSHPVSVSEADVLAQNTIEVL